MRVVSWNVNGIRACVRHGFVDFVDRSGADIVGVQEVRARPRTAHRPPVGRRAGTRRSRSPSAGAIAVSASTRSSSPSGWTPPWAYRGSTERGGSWPRTSRPPAGGLWWSTATSPREAVRDRDNSRVGYKLDFSRTVFARAQALRRRGPVLVIGDYNTAHRVIDLARPQANVTHSGFLPEERAELDRWIDAGWVDVFAPCIPRHLTSTRGGGNGAVRASGTSDGGSTTSSHRRLQWALVRGCGQAYALQTVRARHLPMRYETGLPGSVIRFRT